MKQKKFDQSDFLKTPDENFKEEVFATKLSPNTENEI